MNGETRLAAFNSEARWRTKSCRDGLMKLLDARLKVVHLVLSRLLEIQASATAEMDAFRSAAPPPPPASSFLGRPIRE